MKIRANKFVNLFALGRDMYMVEQLKNQKLVSIGRTCNLIWINFGAEILKKNCYGKEIKTGEYVVDF